MPPEDAWRRAAGAVVDYFRDTAALVHTPEVVQANAVEPYIDPVPAPGGYLQTSPEPAMKWLVSQGSGSVYQLARCARAGERGQWHLPRFHLLEWYRVGDDSTQTRADVEEIVSRVAFAVGAAEPPPFWAVAWLELFAELTGVELSGDEDGPQLLNRCARVLPFPAPIDAPEPVQTLWAWTALYSSWSDEFLDPWLPRQGGVHLVDFPGPLAALAECRQDAGGRPVSGRFESFYCGVELANGYRELRDGRELGTRFATVNALRAAHGQAPLPIPQDLITATDRLPACGGAALGFERLLALARGGRAASVADVGEPPADHALVAVRPRRDGG